MGINPIFVFGGARSGTTWLAKILDSHPRVLYRHEPDIPDDHVDLPVFCRSNEVEQYLEAAQRHITQFTWTRHVRAVGIRPFFKKQYLSPLQATARKSLILGLRGLERLGPLRPSVYRIYVPDFVDIEKSNSVTVVLKSVNSLGRLNLMLKAAPASKFILISRHPCGYVSSRLRMLRNVDRDVRIGNALLASEQAKRHGLTDKALAKMSTLERLAWVWLVFNEKALEDVQNAANVHFLKYESLCESPFDVAKSLFEFVGLEWGTQIEHFVEQSSGTAYSGKDMFSVIRDSKSEIDKWRRQLKAEEIVTIMNIVADSKPGRLYI